MLTLALETSTALASVAILENERCLVQKSSLRQRSHSEFVNQAIDDALNEAQKKLIDLDLVAVGQGPGSFTGIRVAANIAKTLSFNFGKNLLWQDSLTLLAMALPRLNKPVLTIINAYKNMVYCNLFRFQQNSYLPVWTPQALTLEDLQKKIQQPVYVVGDGYAAYESIFPLQLKSLMEFIPSASQYPQAQTLGLICHNRAKSGEKNSWTQYLPLYIRASAAEENMQLK